MNRLEKIVLRHFGRTDDLSETGYVLSDGTLVDLSGRHYASGYIRRGDRFVPEKGGDDWLRGQRSVDHRELPEEVRNRYPHEEGNRSAAMFGFLKDTGALRVSPGVGFGVAGRPTVEALSAFLRGWRLAYGPMPITIDIYEPDGSVEHSFEFDPDRGLELPELLHAR